MPTTRYAHPVRRSVRDTAVRVSDSIAADILLDYRGGGSAKNGMHMRKADRDGSCSHALHLDDKISRGNSTRGSARHLRRHLCFQPSCRVSD